MVVVHAVQRLSTLSIEEYDTDLAQRLQVTRHTGQVNMIDELGHLGDAQRSSRKGQLHQHCEACWVAEHIENVNCLEQIAIEFEDHSDIIA